MNECEWMRNETRARLENHIKQYSKPDWYDWFWLYPAKASVEASRVTLKAMDDGDTMLERLKANYP